MKHQISALLFMLITLALNSSCDQKFETTKPDIVAFEVSTETAEVKETVLISVETTAQLAVVWDGSEQSNYKKHLEQPSASNTGKTITLKYNKQTGLMEGEVGLKYSEPGNFIITVIATNTGNYGQQLLTTMQEKQITILQE